MALGGPAMPRDLAASGSSIVHFDPSSRIANVSKVFSVECKNTATIFCRTLLSVLGLLKYRDTEVELVRKLCSGSLFVFSALVFMS